MESIGGSSGTTAAAAMPSPSVVADGSKATNYEFDPSISEEEKRFYLKAYPTVDVVRDRKTHCTVCKVHIGTAPVQENGIKMHPILRVTHCNKCHDFYNSGEFSKGEDGSELYCRWCGQGGEVYCCSSCPYVFCKSCIVKNLSRGVVADIEQNENWNCFSCAPKILWPLRAQHWALMNYIEQQKKEIYALNLSEHELKINLSKDRSKCCRLAKSKCGNMSDSMESLDSVASKRSHGSTNSAKKPMKHAAPSPQQMNAAKRAKNNDEVVCTPDLLSMLEPDCQITVTPKTNRPMGGTPSATQPKIMSIQQPQTPGYSSTPKSTAPPPLVLRNTAIKLRPAAPPPVVRRTIIGPRTPNPGGNGTPVYHTINGYRIDLNSAAQQETFRLPNGKLIQVKRQGPPPPQNPAPSTNNWQQMSSPQPQRVIPQTIASRAVQITQHPYNISIQQQSGQHPQVVRYHNSMIGSTTINQVPHNGTTIQVLNGQMSTGPQPQQQQVPPQSGPIRPVMVRHVFPDNPIGQARTGLQDQVFNAMEICTHLTNKIQTLTNSNAYKQARNFLEVKELYIHLSYLLTYAIGRFKSLQDKCLGDMRTLGFGNDADCLENGQLAAAVDYVCYGQLDDVDLFNTGSNSFHNQVYEYRKSLHANLKEGEDGTKSPLPPIFSLSQGKSEDVDDDPEGEDSLLEEPKGFKGHWMEGGNDDSPVPNSYNQENEENEEPDESYMDNDDEDGFNRSSARGAAYGESFMPGTEESMRKNEESYAFDRKLTRLVSQYPSIWCTRHPDYGNFEVTRKQWRTIASHFNGNEHIKLRWKNIRKRFVRIEKRIAEGKRFNGHFDKAMAFLANRDLPEDQWVPVDCGEDDGDTFNRYNLDAIEQSLQLQGKDDYVERDSGGGREHDKNRNERSSNKFQPAVKPIDLDPLDLRIITFVKSNPVLWRKSMDPEADKIDEETRKTVWRQLQRYLPHIPGEQIRDRWQHLYEMYKTFRLKTIKNPEDYANLELKYSKYLAKLYFLYKIDEEELRNENNGLFEDCFELEEDEEAEQEAEEQSQEDEEPKKEIKLQDMPDDKEFLLELVKLVKDYPAIWDTEHNDYNDIMVRDGYWQEINEKLHEFKHKQASDDEDNEIEIVEPKTDLITLDSDDDDEPPPKTNSPTKTQVPQAQIKTHKTVTNTPQTPDVKVKIIATPVVNKPTPLNNTTIITTTNNTTITPVAVSQQTQPEENMDLMSMAQSFLASMLVVDNQDESVNSPGSDSSGQKKQPRKKLTNKPNPTLLKQKALMELERLEEMKRNDLKLKMKCSVELKKAEDIFPIAKEMLEARAKEKLEEEEAKKKQLLEEKENDKEKPVTVEIIEDEDKLNKSLEENDKSSEITEKLATEEETIDAKKSSEISKEENSKESLEKDTSMEVVEEIKDKTTDDLTAKEEVTCVKEDEHSKASKDPEEKTNLVEEKQQDIVEEVKEIAETTENKKNESREEIKEIPETTENKKNESTEEIKEIPETTENKKNESTEESSASKANDEKEKKDITIEKMETDKESIEENNEESMEVEENNDNDISNTKPPEDLPQEKYDKKNRNSEQKEKPLDDSIVQTTNESKEISDTTKITETTKEIIETPEIANKEELTPTQVTEAEKNTSHLEETTNKAISLASSSSITSQDLPSKDDVTETRPSTSLEVAPAAAVTTETTAATNGNGNV